MKAKDVQAGDVLIGSDGHWKIRDTRTQTSLAGHRLAELKVSAGRTDPGEWLVFNEDADLSIYRKQGTT